MHSLAISVELAGFVVFGCEQKARPLHVLLSRARVVVEEMEVAGLVCIDVENVGAFARESTSDHLGIISPIARLGLSFIAVRDMSVARNLSDRMHGAWTFVAGLSH